MPKTEENMNSESPDLLHKEHEELRKTPHILITHIQPAELSLATTHSNSTSSRPPITSLPKEQSEPLKLDQKCLNQERLPDHNSTEHVPTVKHREPQDSCVSEQQSAELAPKIAMQVEDLQTPAQFPAYFNSGTPAGLYNWIFLFLSIFCILLLGTDNDGRCNNSINYDYSSE